MTPKVAVILVNWRGAADTCRCLASIAKLNGQKPLTIVVENGSADDSAILLQQAADWDVLIISPVNLGFGGGCNLGINYARTAGTEFIWLLNNDAQPEPDALNALLETLQNNVQVAAAGSIMHENAGPGLEHGYNGGVVNFITGQVRRSRNFAEMQFLSGASLLLRRAALDATGDFNTKYFLYWEDADLCFRLRRAGWLLAVAPGSHVRHAVSASAKKSGRNIIRYFNDSAMRFHRTYAPLPLLPIIWNFSYRFLGQLKAGEFRNAWALVLITLRIDRVAIPKKPANIKTFIRER